MDPFVAEVRIFAGNFAPKGWATCDGQILPISQNTALFSLVGINFGGDGRSTFGLPNLQGKAVMHAGSGPGLTQRSLGETGGTETVTLNVNQIPLHNHNLMAVNDAGDTNQPLNNGFARSSGASVYSPAGPQVVAMSAAALTPIGRGEAHNNMQPYLSLIFIIAIQGIYPPRS
jgi:microcystin-dependent protein